MKSQTFEMALLFDFYGEILTDRQKEFFDLYYNEDLSLAEIAENYSISRQGVRDNIVRAEASLLDFEKKTGLVARFRKMQSEFNEIANSAKKIIELNGESNKEITEYAKRIEAKANALKEE